MSVTYLADVTLADEDNNSIPTNDAFRTILGNVAMQVAKVAANEGGATWWPILPPMQIALLGEQIYN